MATRMRLLEPIHPGEILFHDFMAPLGISINRLARDLDVPPNRIRQIVRGKRALTAAGGVSITTLCIDKPKQACYVWA
jgi:addiction module HigA family antidote